MLESVGQVVHKILFQGFTMIMGHKTQEGRSTEAEYRALGTSQLIIVMIVKEMARSH